MPEILTNFPLQAHTTFGVKVNTRYYCTVSSNNDIRSVLTDDRFRSLPRLILGGGSNILFTKDFKGLVVHPEFDGKVIIEENDHEVVVRAGSGLDWDSFVKWAVDNKYGGVENLSAIPGLVGASPIQNIGAYGCEVKDVIERVEGYDLDKKQSLTFNRKQCAFGYRSSLFKKEEFRNRFLVTHVWYRLQKEPHRLMTHYGPIEEMLEKYPEKTISTLREVIIKIRQAKLPDHKVTGNAGSFFKNPVITKRKADELIRSYTEMPRFESEQGIKLSAAWLIDHAGLKGFRMGNAATHEHQPLVLINTGGATGNEILELARHVRKIVKERFGVELEPEVNII
jgi:UDP-N-acetylmuramate dehydrogenase